MSATETERGNKTDFQARLAASNESALSKYAGIAVGRPGMAALLAYDFASWILAPMPGALGLFLRAKLYPRLLGSSGRGMVIGRNVVIRHPKRIHVGRGVFIDDNCALDAKGQAEAGITIGDGVVIARNTSLSCKGGTIRIGDNSNISGNCMLTSETTLSIGSNVLVAGMTYIVAGGNHGTDRTDIPVIRQECVSRGGIMIEDNVWIGANATILDGVTIGRDSIVGAGAVVTQSIPEFAVAVGVPAKIVKMRKQE